MNEKSRPDLLTAPLFLMGLICLLLNDLFLKYAFSNGLTGKLSDFVGLFIFPYFFAAYRPDKAKAFYWSTAILFIFWKLPLSQSFIDFFNSISIGMYRIVDYSDLVALVVLPISFKYFSLLKHRTNYRKKPLVLLLSAVSVFSFCATTLGGKQVKADIDTDRTFVVNMSKWELLNCLAAGVLPDGTRHYPTQEDLEDSLFYLTYYFHEMDADMKVLAVIQQRDTNATAIRLDHVINGIVNREGDYVNEFKSLNAEVFEQSFDTYFIKQINMDSLGPLTFYNKRILDNYDK